MRQLGDPRFALFHYSRIERKSSGISDLSEALVLEDFCRSKTSDVIPKHFSRRNLGLEIVEKEAVAKKSVLRAKMSLCILSPTKLGKLTYGYL